MNTISHVVAIISDFRLNFRHGSTMFRLQSTQPLLCLSQQQGKTIQVDEHLGVGGGAREKC